MTMLVSNARAALAAVLLAAAAPTVWAGPVTVNPGDSAVPIPVYNSAVVPTYTIDHSTGLETATIITGPAQVTAVYFEELAVKTSLNPAGETFVFALGASSPIGPGTLSGLPGTLNGFKGYSTAVESCDPISAFAKGGCSTADSGTVTRSQDGSTLTFDHIALKPGTISIDGIPVSADFSYAYAVFTNAQTWTDPTGTCFTGASGAGSACFQALGPSGPAGSSGGGGGNEVPEPGVLGLLGLGLVGAMIRRRKSS